MKKFNIINLIFSLVLLIVITFSFFIVYNDYNDYLQSKIQKLEKEIYKLNCIYFNVFLKNKINETNIENYRQEVIFKELESLDRDINILEYFTNELKITSCL